jgi:hypothetical protein
MGMSVIRCRIARQEADEAEIDKGSTEEYEREEEHALVLDKAIRITSGSGIENNIEDTSIGILLDMEFVVVTASVFDISGSDSASSLRTKETNITVSVLNLETL